LAANEKSYILGSSPVYVARLFVRGRFLASTATKISVRVHSFFVRIQVDAPLHFHSDDERDTSEDYVNREEGRERNWGGGSDFGDKGQSDRYKKAGGSLRT
ncbi:unnamed protein product, partial [Scytosiphon promiscuus]